MREKLEQFRENIEIKDIAIIIFFASRAYTALFSMFLGTKGIYASMGVLAIIYLMGIISSIKKKDYDIILYFIILVFTVTIGVIITAIINPLIKEWLLSPLNGIIIKTFDVRKSIFATFVILLVKDNKRIIKNLEISAIITFFYMIIQIGLFIYSNSWISYFMVRDENLILYSYNMSLGYELIFVAIVLLNRALNNSTEKIRFVSYILGILAFFFSFTYGSRGIMIPIIAYLILSFIFNVSRKQKFKILKYIIISIVICIILFWIWGYIENINTPPNQSPNVGTDEPPRNMEMLVSGEFTSSNGRDKIYSLALNAIKQKFPLGFGVYGDRPFIGDRFRWGYSHNFFLELIVSFGIFGLILIFGLIYFTIKILTKDKYKDYKELLIILLAMNAKLLISDSFWHYDYFWALIGLYIIVYMDQIKPKVRLKAYIASFLLIVNIVLLVFFVKIDMGRQAYNRLVFNEPTVIVSFDGNNENNYKMYEVLKNLGLKGTSFINIDNINRSGNLKENTLKELAEYGWDIQELVEDEFLDKRSKKELKLMFEDKNMKYRELGLQEPDIFAPSNGDLLLDTALKTMEYRDGIRLRDKRRSFYYLTDLKESDFYKLGSLYMGNLESLSFEEKLTFVKRHIDIAGRNKALIILTMENLEANNNIKNMENIQLLNEIILHLMENNFEFKTINDLVQDAKIQPEQKTLINYLIRNNPISGTISN